MPDLAGTVQRLAVLVRQLQGMLQGERRVRGNVGADGSIGAGAGFTVTHAATGVYTVAFARAFGGVPSVTVTPIGVQRFFCISSGPAAGSFQVTFSNTIAGSGVDQAFSFVAVGPVLSAA